mgnify:FL=1
MKQKIGFCGLGKMGSVMAPLFIEAGYSLTVYNRSSEKTDPLKRIGASIAELPSEVSEESEIIFTMLSDDEAIESIYLSKDGLLSADINGRLFIDMSTIKPKTVLKISNEVQKKSGSFIDAPVSGTVAPAAKGELLIFCGGDAEHIKRAKPFLDILARRIIHAGKIGSGSLLKLVVNLPLAIYWQALAESILLGKSGQLSEEVMLDAIADSSAALAVLKMKIPIMLGEDMPVAFDMKSMVKDLSVILQTAEALDVEIPTTKSAYEIYSKAIKDEKYTSADAVKIIDYMKRK